MKYFKQLVKLVFGFSVWMSVLSIWMHNDIRWKFYMTVSVVSAHLFIILFLKNNQKD